MSTVTPESADSVNVTVTVELGTCGKATVYVPDTPSAIVNDVSLKVIRSLSLAVTEMLSIAVAAKSYAVPEPDSSAVCVIVADSLVLLVSSAAVTVTVCAVSQFDVVNVNDIGRNVRPRFAVTDGVTVTSSAG